jgi:Tol biopolymer transport system component
MIMGTARYMSPEQARGLAVDARTDVWSLGVVLYEMVAGCAPFGGATDSDVMVSILEREPLSLTRQVSEVPLELQRIVSKALRKDREERYQVIKDMLLDLKSLRQNNESDANLALPTILGAAARSLFGSRRWIAPVVAGIVLLALGLTWWFRPSFPPPRVLGYTQLTNNGHPKSRLQTDGTRLYFWQLGGNMEVSVGGGEVVPLQPSFPVLDVSLSRSEFLIAICDRPPDPDMSLHSIPMVGGAPRQLAHTSSLSAKWSPDGRQLVYSQPTSLQIANADGTNSRQLVALENEPFGLHWSPDGKKLRFSLYDLKSKKTDIWEIFADGTNLHRWFPDWRPDLQKGEGCWMPDGKYFVFATSPSLVTQRGGGQQFGLWAARETTDVFHQPVHDPIQLMTGPTIFHDLVASPDGTKLFAVSSGKGRGELVRYDVKSGEWRPAFSGMSSQFVSFSLDGNWMAYVSYPDGTLWRSKTDGSQRLQLTFPPLEVALPRWSPDGTRISYTARTGTDNRKIYVIAAEGGDSQCLTQGDYLEEDPVWSPDGESLAFERLEGTGPEESRRSSIQILNLALRKTTLLPDSFGKFSPRWSADGRFIAAMPFPGSRGLLLFDFQKQKWEPLVQGFGVGYPSFSRDGKSVYFVRFHASDLYRVKISDRSFERIASMKESVSGDFGSWLGLDPSDAPLILKDVSSGEEVFALEWQAP